VRAPAPAVRTLARARPGSPWAAELVEARLDEAVASPELVPVWVRVLHHAGEDDRAARLARRAVEAWPGHRTALRAQLRAFAWRGDPRGSIADWVGAWPADRPAICQHLAHEGYGIRAARTCPDAPGVRRARWWLDAGRPRAAWRAIGPELPDTSPARRAWVDVALAVGAAPRVLRQLDIDDLRADPALWERWVRSAQVAGSESRVAEALASPPDPTPAMDRGTAGRIHALLRRHRGRPAARAFLEKMTPIAREEAGLVSAELRHDRTSWREHLIRRANLGPLAPGDAAQALVRGAWVPDAGSVDEQLERIRRRHPDDPDVLFAVARHALARGQPDAARTHAARAARLAPRDPEAWAVFGDALRDHDLDRAKRAWRRALRVYEQRSASGWTARKEAARRVRERLSRS